MSETYSLFSGSDNFESDNELDSSVPTYKFTYKGSYLTLDEFDYSFMCVCQKLNLNRNHRSILLRYIKRLLPSDNSIPKSYNQLVRKYTNNNVDKFSICISCNTKIDPKQVSCSNLMCPRNSNLNLSSLSKWKSDVIIFDFEKQLEIIYLNTVV